MKKNMFTALMLLMSVMISVPVLAQNKKKKTSEPVTESPAPFKMTSKQDSISYIIGHDIGKNMVTNNIKITPDAMFAGLKDGLQGIDTTFSPEATQQIMNQFQQEMMDQQENKSKVESAKARAEGEAFLKSNKEREDVIELPSGLQYEVITEGEGSHPTADDVVEVHYTGKLLDGTVFDSSVERGESIKFPLNGVIAGWTEGVQLMTPGSKYIFYIPAQLAYGDRSAGPIPPGSTLIFEVELISIGE
ncbi:MAG: FKBP-type peptidyl-prolyl cis-trans isomerase [Lentimicrobiaceae bacterium]|mgnify:FL=1|jgi:FKBP-type peptidyl-prolyl cis-trans isomerase|nr:FKBP-type peptidyl-prolyl cis-trans isomerase [Lentimicrobiaceae bacterium]MDY0026868.1 FKBP-type peptidyl-prolyl cis-trans isomerase [Lentimicrobium sp.]